MTSKPTMWSYADAKSADCVDDIFSNVKKVVCLHAAPHCSVETDDHDDDKSMRQISAH